MSYQYINSCRKPAVSQSNIPTLILKRWKSCLSLSLLFFFLLKCFLLLACPPPLPPSLPVSLLFLSSADREYCLLLYCQRKHVPHLWGIFLHPHLYLCAIMFSFSASYAYLPACVAPTSSKALSALSMYKSDRACFSVSPSTRIRYCHLLSAVISLPSSDSLSGAAICYNVFVLCVYSPVWILHIFTPSPAFSVIISKSIFWHILKITFPSSGFTLNTAWGLNSMHLFYIGGGPARLCFASVEPRVTLRVTNYDRYKGVY